MAGKRHGENVTSTRHMTSATCQGHGKPLSGYRDWTYDAGMVTMPLSHLAVRRGPALVCVILYVPNLFAIYSGLR